MSTDPPGRAAGPAGDGAADPAGDGAVLASRGLDSALHDDPGGVGGAAARAYVLALGDDALILSHRLTEWITRAPALEEELALANIALDLLGQARGLLERAGQLGEPAVTADDLAYLRDARGFRNCLLVELENGDFARTMARQLLFSAWQLPLYERLRHSSDAAVAGLASAGAREAAYHLDHAALWVRRLGDGTEESHRRMQEGLETVWPYAAELFEPEPFGTELSLGALVERGLAVEPASLEPAWLATVHQVVTEAALEVPAGDWRPVGGRRGLHTEAFGFLLAELQSLRRTEPEASW